MDIQTIIYSEAALSALKTLQSYAAILNKDSLIIDESYLEEIKAKIEELNKDA